MLDFDGRIAHANAAWRGLRQLVGDTNGRSPGEACDQLQAIVERARRHGHAEGSLREDGTFQARAESLEGTESLLVTLRPAADEVPLPRPALLDGAPDAVARLTTAGQISYANPALARLAGRELSSLLGVDFEQLVVQSHQLVWRQALRRAGTSGTARVSLPLAGGGMPAPTIDVLLVNDAGRAFYAYGQDITDQIAREERSRQAQRIDSAGKLAAGISHDFNNLLTVIQANLSQAVALAEQQAKTDSELAPLLRGAEAAAQNAAELSRQLLTIGRATAAHREAVALAPLIEEMLNLLRRTIDPNIELAAQVPSDLTVLVSASQIQPVLFNLALNAIDAMPRGGRIRSTAEATTRAPAGLPTRPEGYVRIECSDTSEGMDPSTAARIFEPYFSTKADGNGLGLAMVYGILEEHGGAISARSAPGSGTTMVIHLPGAREAEVIETDRAPLSLKPCPRRQESAPLALVVDDHDALRRVCVSILRRAGYRVVEAETGDEVLRRLEALAATPSIALIDASMPGLSGAETAAELLRIAPELRILLLSGYAPENVTQPSEGRHRFLQKPFDSDALLAAIDEITHPA